MNDAERVDTLPGLVYVNALFIIGTVGTLITPALLDVWANLHWSTTRLGIVAALELAGLGIGSLSGLYWQRRWNWRRVAFVSLIVGLAANAACIGMSDYVSVLVMRALAGLSAGFLAALYSAVLANCRSPGRVIAVTTFVQIGVEAVFLYGSSALFESLGSAGLFILMGALFAALIPFVRVLAAGWPHHAAGIAEETSKAGSRRAYPLLASFVPFILVQTGVYTFLGEFGRSAAHLSEAQALHAIGISVLLSSLGSVAAFVLDNRLGLKLPIAVGVLLIALSICGMILDSTSEGAFLCYISLFQIGYVFLNCYLYSALIDADNLLVPAATPVSTLGSVFGAGVMGYVLEQGGLSGALTLCVGAMTLTALLTLPFLKAKATFSAEGSGHESQCF